MNEILNLSTNQLPTDERPYEKCKKYGAQALDDSELLAVILILALILGNIPF